MIKSGEGKRSCSRSSTLKQMVPDSLWQATAPGLSCEADLNDDLTCDVAIVGSGFTGLRAAIELAEAGSDVVVLDARGVGMGASGRSGGQVNPMLPVARPEQLRQAVGAEKFEQLAETSLSSADEVFELVRRYGIECDARQKGWLRVDHCASARETARKAAEAWNAFGADFEFVDGEDVVRLTGSPAYRSAVLNRRGGAVHPLALVRGLAQVASNTGVRIFRNAPVASFDREEATWVLSAAGHRIRSRSIVFATNGYADSLFPQLMRSIIPLTPIQIATDTLEKSVIEPILPDGHTISDTRRLIMYARREPGDRIVFGGIGFRRPLGSTGGFQWLLDDVRKIYPMLANADWKWRWGGRIALTPDRIPHFHEPFPGCFAGLGYNGRGVAMSLVMGRVLARRVLGDDPKTLPFPVSPIRSAAFRNVQFVGAGLAMTWMRLRDTMEFASGR